MARRVENTMSEPTSAKRLLVVDDALIMRAMIKDIARQAGWEIAGEATNDLGLSGNFNAEAVGPLAAVLTGTLENGRFEATEMSAKCPSKYEAADEEPQKRAANTLPVRD